MASAVRIRALAAADAESIEHAFAEQGWRKPAAQYMAYYREQESGERDVLVAEWQGEFAGYVTLVWRSDYRPFRDAGIPEIVDLNVLRKHQRKGVATALLEEAEQRIAVRAQYAGIGVGMTADYGPAQILYVRRGYRPDGRGLAVHGTAASYGQTVAVDDDLTLYFTRRVRTLPRQRSTAIVETEGGILLAAMTNGLFLLPGGGVEGGETHLETLIRELKEETGLVAESALYLFEHQSSTSHHHVYYVLAGGRPRPCNETRFLAYYVEGADIPLSTGTRAILKRFSELKQARPALFDEVRHAARGMSVSQ